VLQTNLYVMVVYKSKKGYSVSMEIQAWSIVLKGTLRI